MRKVTTTLLEIYCKAELVSKLLSKVLLIQTAMSLHKRYGSLDTTAMQMMCKIIVFYLRTSGVIYFGESEDPGPSNCKIY